MTIIAIGFLLLFNKKIFALQNVNIKEWWITTSIINTIIPDKKKHSD